MDNYDLSQRRQVDFLRIASCSKRITEAKGKKPANWPNLAHAQGTAQFMNKSAAPVQIILLGVIITITIIAILTLLYGQRLAGQWMASQETARLRAAEADPQHLNPPAQSDSFAGKLSSAWAFETINGAGQIGPGTEFHNTRLSLEDGLTISQQFDLDFEQESPAHGRPASERYNNASVIGLQGYQPTPSEDVLFQARMQVSPDFYGTAGFMLQPVGTLLADGSFQGRFKNEAFTLFGIGFIGPESNLFGRSGTTVQKVINWWPEEVQGLEVDMHEPHTYLLRLHWIDAQSWQGITSIDGKVVSRLDLPPFGPVEVHIWGDNYRLGTSLTGTPQVGFQNGQTKWIRFDEVSAWTEAVKQ
jgi:hypothetical protein